MKTKVSGKNIEITEALRNAVQTKMEKVGKYFQTDTEAQATLSVEKNRQIVEVTIPINGSLLRAEEETYDMYESIDRVVDKLNKQIQKYKTRLQRRYKGHDTIRFEYIPNIKEDEEEIKIVRTKRFPVKPMAAEEAVLQMELIGHSFFVFTNANTSEVNVVYKRKDGNYGLIEPTV
jgi:putative sigma-54 modulation protein